MRHHSQQHRGQGNRQRPQGQQPQGPMRGSQGRRNPSPGGPQGSFNPDQPQWRSQSAWEDDPRHFEGQEEFEQRWGHDEPWSEEDEAGGRGGQGFSQRGYAGGGGDYYGQGQQSGTFGQGGYGTRGEQHWSGSGGMGYQRGDVQPQRRYAPGPKGYKRSDERIKEDVSDRVSQMNMVDASDVEIEVKSGEVTLTGTVPNRIMKWQLENMIESVAGVLEVHNQLRVKREDPQGERGPTRGSGIPGMHK